MGPGTVDPSSTLRQVKRYASRVITWLRFDDASNDFIRADLNDWVDLYINRLSGAERQAAYEHVAGLIADLPYSKRAKAKILFFDTVSPKNVPDPLEQLAAATGPNSAELAGHDEHEASSLSSTANNETLQEVGWTKCLADSILSADSFAIDASGLLYRCDHGVYRPVGRRFIGQRCKQLLESWKSTKSWSTSRVREVYEYIHTDAPRLWPRPPLNRLNVKNGLLDLETGELHPHTPDHRSSIQLPVEYDPQADCPTWHKFVEEIFPEDCSQLPWELLAWLMTPDTSIQKAVLLLGEGRNGKSTFLTAVRAFLGRENVSGLSLHKLETDRFATARLVGKLANICPDLPSYHVVSTSTFKALAGGDAVHAERKYGESFEFEPFARLVFAANQPPQSADSSGAFFRRWLVVPFERTFIGQDEIPRSVLDAQLADPQELSGVLNMALSALHRIRAQGITESQSMREAWRQFQQVAHPIMAWLDTYVIQDTEAYVTKADLLQAYNEYAKANGQPVLSDKLFYQTVRQWNPDIREGQKRLGEGRPTAWFGIRLKTVNFTED